jgi:hypothetical protein
MTTRSPNATHHPQRTKQIHPATHTQHHQGTRQRQAHDLEDHGQAAIARETTEAISPVFWCRTSRITPPPPREEGFAEKPPRVVV